MAATAIDIHPVYGLVSTPEQYKSPIARVLAAAEDKAKALMARSFAFDIETGYDGEARPGAAVHPEENFVVGISFTCSFDWAVYIPIRHDFSTANVDPEVIAPLLWRMLRTGMGVGHNVLFELRCLSRFFVEYLSDHPEYGDEVRALNGYFPIFSDGMIEGYSLACHKSYALKPMCKEIFGHQMTEIGELFADLPKNRMKQLRFNTLDPTDPKVVAYACEDSVWELAIHRKYWPKIQASKTAKFIYNLEMSVLRECMAPLEDTGVKYDWKFMREAAQRGRVFMDKLNAEIQADLSEMIGTKVDVNLGSPAQIAEVLYEKLGMRTHRLTRGSQHSDGPKKMSTDALALKGLAAQYPVVRRILEWKQLRRLITVYLEKYEVDYSYAPDGMTHPSYMQTAVLTGRFAVAGPPVQQSPKLYRYELKSGEVFELNFRDAIVAPKDYYLIGFDVSQGELRVIAGEAQEMALIESYRKGEDIHRKTASLMLGKPYDDLTDDDRQFGKTLNFALMFRMSPDSLAERLGCSKEESRTLYQQYFSVYSSIEVWAERSVRFGKEHGYTMSKFGRRHPIWEFQATEHWQYQKGERLCVNAPIQGGLADYVKMAMVRIQRALKAAPLSDGAPMVSKVKMCMNVHDAVYFYAHRSVSPASIIRVVQAAALFPVQGWPSMALDWSVGVRWGSMRHMEVSEDGNVMIKTDVEVDVEPLTEDGTEAAVPVVKVDLQRVRFPDVAAEQAPESAREASPVPEVEAEPEVVAPASREDGPEVPEDQDMTGAREVFIEADRMPTPEAFSRLLDVINRDGMNTVVLKTPEGPIQLTDSSALTPADAASVSMILGGARVVYAPSSVEPESVTKGMVF